MCCNVGIPVDEAAIVVAEPMNQRKSTFEDGTGHSRTVGPLRPCTG
jgi:hypothetical protein